MAARKKDALPPKMGLFSSDSLLADPNYDPAQLLDDVRETLNLKNDLALCLALEIGPSVISKVRNKKTPVTALLLVRMHEVSEVSIRDLRLLMFKLGD